MVFAINMNWPCVYMCPPSWTSLPPPFPTYPSGFPQSTGFVCSSSCMELALVIYFHMVRYMFQCYSFFFPPFYLFFFSTFFSFIFISWRLITLQYCSGFCHTLTWISHGFTCIPHPDPPSHLTSLSTRSLWVFLVLFF